MSKKDEVFEWEFNGVIYYGKPWHVINIEGDSNNGMELWQAIGMSESEKDSTISDFYLFKLRLERDRRLKETDWVSGEDIPQNIKDLYFPYRLALRNLTDTYTSIRDVVWPTKPE